MDHALFPKLSEPQHVPTKGTLENVPANFDLVG